MGSIMNVRKRFIQARHFWYSIIFGPERKLSPITEIEGFDSLVEDILLWLNELFSTPSNTWELVNASKNPHSEIFLFRQIGYSNIPGKVFIKRFIIQLENTNETLSEELLRESNALKRIEKFNGRYDVHTPIIYGLNKERYSIATSFQEGDHFFNVLFESPVKVVSGKYQLSEFCKCLSNLGYWLKEVHNTKESLPNMDNHIKSILNRDLSGIQMHVNHLEKVRPVGFSRQVCDNILARSHELVQQVLKDTPGLRTVHGDFTLSNILYNAEKLSLLDYATLGLGLPEDDLARIYLDLKNVENYSFLFTPGKRGTLISAFFYGYGRRIDANPNACEAFHIIKHCIINIYMYTKHWGNKQFLNPFLCRLFYSFQKKILFNLINV